jgi:hypothetical protein
MNAVEKVLDMIGEVQGMLDLEELIDGLLVAIQRYVPCGGKWKPSTGVPTASPM